MLYQNHHALKYVAIIEKSLQDSFEAEWSPVRDFSVIAQDFNPGFTSSQRKYILDQIKKLDITQRRRFPVHIALVIPGQDFI